MNGKHIHFIGDVDVNQRKGKLFAIFDIKIKLKWTASKKDMTTIHGSILIPEGNFIQSN